jgi:hypothetical protein
MHALCQVPAVRGIAEQTTQSPAAKIRHYNQIKNIFGRKRNDLKNGCENEFSFNSSVNRL